MSGESINYDLTTKEAAKLLGVSEKTVRRRAKSGQLSHITVKGKRNIELRFSSDEIRQLVSKDIQDGQRLDISVVDPTQSQAYRDLMTRHEQVIFQLGQYQERVSRMKELEETIKNRDEELERLREENKELKAELEEAKMSWWEKLKAWIKTR